MRAAVIGHVEWVDFIRVDRVPAPGEIVHATSVFEEPAGGGSVAAVQLAKLAGEVTFYTALGDDERGTHARSELEARGVRVEAAVRAAPQRRAVTFIDADGERTIAVLGERISPRAQDPLRWDELSSADVVYVCAADPEAVRLARAARVVVATSRMLDVLREAAAELDALVGSAADPGEAYRDGDLDPAPRLVVRTAGVDGGEYRIAGRAPVPFTAEPLPGPVVDAYGCGDSFAAGLAFAIARGEEVPDAVRFAARCGAAVLAGRGPYEGQLSSFERSRS
jgi:ribokinase